MEIQYATSHAWVKEVPSEALLSFGKNAQANLRSTLTHLHEYPISTELKKLDAGFLDEFLPRYEQRIQEKKNPVIFDIREKTLGENPKRTYYSFALYEAGIFLGGTIFSLRKDRLSIAYRIYEKNWIHAPLRANPSLYTEYELCKIALSFGRATITHGKDRNPYGLNSNIGLAGFKLSVGCQPTKSHTYECKTLETNELTEDTLVLEYPGESTDIINHAYLITTPETESQWLQVSKYPKRLQVDVLYRNNGL